METLSVDLDTLNDLLASTRFQTYDYWLTAIEKYYPTSIVIDHPLVSQFKFFTIWPTTLVFYINPETNVITREAVAVRSVFYSSEMYNLIDFNKAILLGVFKKEKSDVNSDNYVVRYALSKYDILPYKFEI